VTHFRAHLVVIRGLPGSGKSTAAKKFIEAGYTHLEADMYHINKKTGAYEFDLKRRATAWEWTKETASNLLYSGQNVVLSGVFPRNELLQKLKDGCNYIGVSFTVLTAEADHGNIHDVPADVLDGMRSVWEPLSLK
jgi:predicted kinase